MNWDASQQATADRLKGIVGRVLEESPSTAEFRFRFVEDEFGEFSGGWWIPIAADAEEGDARLLASALDQLQQKIEAEFTEGRVNVVLDPALS